MMTLCIVLVFLFTFLAIFGYWGKEHGLVIFGSVFGGIFLGMFFLAYFIADTVKEIDVTRGTTVILTGSGPTQGLEASYDNEVISISSAKIVNLWKSNPEYFRFSFKERTKAYRDGPWIHKFVCKVTSPKEPLEVKPKEKKPEKKEPEKPLEKKK
jgi:hypothetical protein